MRWIFLPLLLLSTAGWALDQDPITNARVIIQSPSPLPDELPAGQVLEMTVLAEGRVGLYEYKQAGIESEATANKRLVQIGPVLIDQKSIHVELENGNLAIYMTGVVAAANPTGMPPFTLKLTGENVHPLKVTTQAAAFLAVSRLKSDQETKPVYTWSLVDTGGISRPRAAAVLAALLVCFGGGAWLYFVALPRWRKRKTLTPLEQMEVQTGLLADISDAKEYAFACVNVFKKLLEFLEEEISPDMTDSEILERLKRGPQKIDLAQKADALLTGSFDIRYAKGAVDASKRIQWHNIVSELLERSRQKDAARRKERKKS